jgi:branched-subunit amino acid transport protein
MSDAAIVISALIVTTFVIRASGPVLLGGRELPPRALDVIVLVAPALLAALVTTQTFGGKTGGELVLDERAIGVAGAGVVVALRGSVLWALAVAIALTAGARAIL